MFFILFKRFYFLLTFYSEKNFLSLIEKYIPIGINKIKEKKSIKFK